MTHEESCCTICLSVAHSHKRETINYLKHTNAGALLAASTLHVQKRLHCSQDKHLRKGRIISNVQEHTTLIHIWVGSVKQTSLIPAPDVRGVCTSQKERKNWCCSEKHWHTYTSSYIPSSHLSLSVSRSLSFPFSKDLLLLLLTSCGNRFWACAVCKTQICLFLILSHQLCLSDAFGPWGLRRSELSPGPHGTLCYPACTAASAVHTGPTLWRGCQQERAGTTARIALPQDRAPAGSTLRWVFEQIKARWDHQYGSLGSFPFFCSSP